MCAWDQPAALETTMVSAEPDDCAGSTFSTNKLLGFNCSAQPCSSDVFCLSLLYLLITTHSITL